MARRTKGGEAGATPRGRQIVQAPVSWTLTPKGAKALRARHNGFDPKKQRRFIKTLRKTGCVRDAARVAGVSTETAYRTRRRLPEFRKKWETALRMAASDIEMLAWERAVDGAEVTTMRGGEMVSVTRKPSDAILRLLMQGSNPEKYGRMAAARRETIEREVREELAAAQADIETVRARIMAKLEIVQARELAHARKARAAATRMSSCGSRRRGTGRRRASSAPVAHVRKAAMRHARTALERGHGIARSLHRALAGVHRPAGFRRRLIDKPSAAAPAQDFRSCG